MAVDLQTFEPTYQPSERGAEVVGRLKTLVLQSRILCAGGAGLEYIAGAHRRNGSAHCRFCRRWLALGRVDCSSRRVLG